MSSKGLMQWLEMSVDRQLLAGMVARTVGLTMLTEVGDVWAGRRHEPADSGIVVRDHVTPETPWQPPWSQHVVADAASAELQGRLWHGSNEPQGWEETGGAAVDKQEVRPGRSCHSRVLNGQATPTEWCGRWSFDLWNVDLLLPHIQWNESVIVSSDVRSNGGFIVCSQSY